jgi:hypothetical protein
MKVATIIYHKNIKSIYKKEWIDDCINSIKNQSYTDFILYELNYGDGELNLSKEYNVKQENHYYQMKFDNHGEAMNFLLDECLQDGCDVVINNNMDDYSDEKRFEIQLEKIKEGYDIVSSNFRFVNGEGLSGKEMRMSDLNTKYELLEKNHNVICHPSVCYSRNFLLNNEYDGGEIPEEDFLLWKRTVSNYRFFICDEFLINYRFHENQITAQNKFKQDKLDFIKEENRLMKKMNIEFLDPITLEKIKKDSITTSKDTTAPIIDLSLISKAQNRRDGVFPTGDTTVRKRGFNPLSICVCGEQKNKVKYNFCQKCNKLY